VAKEELVRFWWVPVLPVVVCVFWIAIQDSLALENRARSDSLHCISASYGWILMKFRRGWPGCMELMNHNQSCFGDYLLHDSWFLNL